MTAEQLKKSLLQEAVQGRLVPQDPNDEPASELLARIRAEKARLAKEGKIKPGTPSNRIYRGADGQWYEKSGKTERCIHDEIPFDIPDSWQWVRLGMIAIINPRNSVDDSLDVGFIPMEMLQGGYGSSYSYQVRKWKDVKKGFTHFAENDIVIAKITPCFQNRKSAVIESIVNRIGAGTTELHVIRTYSESIIRKYLLYNFKSERFIASGIASFTATAGQQRVNINIVQQFLIPLPPLAEQKRIVAKLDELLPKVEEYGMHEQKLRDLHTTFPAKLKKSLLQEAVQGRLVPQDPNDEPASELLARIHMEKARLAKERKIKQDKTHSHIYRGADGQWYEKTGKTERCIQDEIPFDIPNSWEWVRLSEAVYNHGQKEPKQQFCYIDIGSIDNKKQQLNKENTIIEAQNAPSRARRIVEYGDVLYSTVRPYLHNVCVIDRGFPLEPIASTGFAVMACFALIYNRFLFYYLLSPNFDVYANHNDNAKGVSYPAINDKRFYHALVPIPPLHEQKRIVAKLEQLLPMTEQYDALYRSS